MICWSASGEMATADLATLEAVGWTAADLGIGGPGLHPELSTWTQCRATGRVVRSRQLRVTRPNGTVRWLTSSSHALDSHAPGPWRVATVIRDVTEARTADAAAAERLAALNEANEIKTGMVAAASHELRTPLTGLLGALETLEACWDVLDAPGRLEMLAVARRSGTRIEGITADLFSLAQAQANSLRIEPEVLPVVEIVTDMLADSVVGQDEVLVDIPEDLEVIADPGHVERIIRNLVTNAQRYGAPPISIVARADGAEIEIQVSDCGLGVAPEFVSRLFEQFTRNAGQVADGGSGLGLAIVDTLVRANAGSIRYEPGEPGARFCVRLPSPATFNSGARTDEVSAPVEATVEMEESAAPSGPAGHEQSNRASAAGLVGGSTSFIEWELDSVTGSLWATGPVATVLQLPDETDALPSLRTLLAPVVEVVCAGIGWDDYELEVPRTDAEGEEVGRLLVRAQKRRDGTVSGVVLDITDRSATAERLAELLDRFKLLIELSPDMVVVHQAGIVRYINRIGMQMVKAEETNQVVGLPITDFVAPGSLGALRERLSGLEHPGDVSEPAEIWLRARDGSEVFLESVSVRTTWEGQPAFQVILRDLSYRRRAEAAVRYQAGLVGAVSDAIIATGPDGRVRSWNPAAERLYGRTVGEVVGQPLVTLLGPDAMDEHNDVRAGTVRHSRSDGTWLTVEVSVAPLPGDRGQAAGQVAICADRTEAEQSAMERERAARRLATVVSALSEGILVVEFDGTVSLVNEAAQRMLGAPALGESTWAGLASAAHLCRTDGSPLPIEDNPVMRAWETGQNQRDVTVGFTAPDSALRWVSLNCEVLEAGLVSAGRAVVCSFTDVTERRAVQARLRHDATHDSLTGLPNRLNLLRTLDDLLRAARAGGTNDVAALFVDLDRFKAINDAHGHHIGDEVLRVAAERVTQVVGRQGTAARLSGDEFVVVLSGLDRANVVALAERVQGSLSVPIPVGTAGQITLTASVGVVIANPASAAESVLADADLAMYEAKRLGRSRVEVFNAPIRAAAHRRSEIANRLNLAIANDHLSVVFQPIIDLRTAQLDGAEALVRWTDPSLGVIGPAEFIPIAEEFALISDLGRSVLAIACRAGALSTGPRPLKLSVNLSPRQLTDPRLMPDIRRVLDETGLDPGRLWFEVTESAVMENVEGSKTVLDRIRDLGAHLSIDDFGTGYSSLAYLRRLPVETLKIDRSFVSGIGNPGDDAIVGAVVDLAHTLGRTVVAEGVETVEQLNWLKAIGCDAVQGYLTGRAAPSYPTATERNWLE